MTTSQVAMPTTIANPISVAARKTYQARDGSMVDKMRIDVNGWGVNQVREFMRIITVGEMDQQMMLGNPPEFSNVDGVMGRGIAYAQRRITVSFGTRLKMQALNALKAGLGAAIAHSTKRVTGTLGNMANWTFRYVRDGRVQDLPISGSAGIPMGPRDFIVLMPTRVIDGRGRAYATAANMRVAHGGKLSFRKSATSRVTKANQSIGFLALASRAAQASAAFSGFTVTAGFSIKHAVRGEVVKLGGVRTGYIKIRAKTGSARNR